MAHEKQGTATHSFSFRLVNDPDSHDTLWIWKKLEYPHMGIR